MTQPSPSVSPIRWMIARKTRHQITGPLYTEVIADGFKKITAAKREMISMNEDNLIIMCYYE